MDRDGTNQVENHNGMPTCEVVGDATVATPIGSGTIATDGDESLARINASDGDRLTVRAGTHIQEIYVDGEAPTFSEVAPGDGDRFKSAELRIGFEVRDGGAGLRHDGENVVSVDGDAVLHDAANTTNTAAADNDDARVGDGDGITDREPISSRNGGSQDIDVTFYTDDQFGPLADYEVAKAAADKARGLADDAFDDAVAAAKAAGTAAGVEGDSSAVDPVEPATGVYKAQDDATAAAATEREKVSPAVIDAAAAGALDTAAGELGDAAGDLVTASEALNTLDEDSDSAQISQTLERAADAAELAAGTTGARGAAATARTAAAAATGGATSAAGQALTVAAKALEDAAQELEDAAEAFDEASMLEIAAFAAEGMATTAEMTADATAGGPDDGVYGTLIDDHGSSGWTMVTRGTAYKANIVYYITGQDTNVLKYQWMVTAKDRVGNEGKASKNRFDLTIDTVAPQVSVARTGISYDVDKNKEVRNRNYIALTFTNDEGGAEDPIATSTLDVRDFIVEGFEVVDIIHPELLDDAKTDGEYKVKDAVGIDTSKESTFDAIGARDPRSRVYLELDSELGSAETPRIQILGGAVTDLAGNQNDPPQQITSIDKIPAGLTISVESSDSSSGRTVATVDGTFTVTVDADEPLKRTPRVYFSRFGVTGEHSDADGIEDGDALGRYTLPSDLNVSPLHGSDGEVDAAPALEVIERDLAWTRDYDADEDAAFGSVESNIYAVLVWSEDTAGNAGSSAGWTDAGAVEKFTKRGRNFGPHEDDTLDLAALNDAGLLIEIDRGIEDPDVTVLPSAGDNDVTESSNPYLQLIFNESAENTAALTFEGVDKVEASAEDVTPVVVAKDAIPAINATFTSLKDGSDTTSLDAHKKITLTAATLDGEDVSGSIGPGLSTSEDRFVVALRNLAAGTHTFTYSAVDEAGNELTDEEIEFEVKARAAYEIDIRPGWNLISLPGTPTDSSIGGVMEATLDAAIVLGYQNGAWVSAIRNEGEWQGTLTDMVGGYGYWVQTTVFEAIEAEIPSADPTDVLPSVPVIAGWNLLGVVDISQGEAGSEPIGKEEADDYFVSIDWRVGYYFNNESNDWQKIVPDAQPSDDGAEILNGKGYWIWSIRPGKLVP